MIDRRQPRVHRVLARLRRDCKGATAVEYGLILALIVIALVAGLTGLGGQSMITWTGVYDKVKAVTPN